MDYQKIYDSIIEIRKVNVPIGYTEMHHIVPRSLGGTDNKNNLVRLTAREHFVCHLLLTKIKLSQYKHAKMVRAFMFMLASNGNQQRYFSSRNYKKLKEEFAKLQSDAQAGTGNSQHGTKWIHNVALKVSKKIKRCEDIPEGWKTGRVINFTTATNKLLSDKHRKEYLAECLAENVRLHCRWSAIYLEVGFIEFCKITGYDKSLPNLIRRFKLYVPGYNISVQSGETKKMKIYPKNRKSRKVTEEAKENFRQGSLKMWARRKAQQ